MKEYRMSEPVLLNTLKKIYGSLMAISGKKILVIRDLKIALLLAVRNTVVYVTDDPDCAEQFRKNTEAGMGKDDVVILINKWTNKLKFTKVFEKMGRKFDVCIQNPPYDRNLHLKILEAVIPHAEKVVNISPVRWLQDPFAPYSTRSDYCKFENTISQKIESLDVISAKNASQLFNATFAMNLGIYVCGNGGYEYQHNDPLITKIVEKTMTNSWKPFNQKVFYQNGCVQTKPYALNICGFGGSTTMGFDILTCRTYEAQCETALTDEHTGNVVNATHFEFDSEAERRNFFNCYNHPFMRWHTGLWKIDVNLHAPKVPYFSDYSHPWDYADFFAWFGLTEEEQERVMREIAEMQAE